MPTKHAREVAAVLRRAAELVDSGREGYGCDAITKIAGENTAEKALDALWGYFKPNEEERGFIGFWPDSYPARVLGLLLAAEIVEQGEGTP